MVPMLQCGFVRSNFAFAIVFPFQRVANRRLPAISS
jgi:hypothetical protein